MEGTKILVVIAIIFVLLPSAIASRFVVSFETLLAIASEVSIAQIGNPLWNIIFKDLDNNGATCGSCTVLGKPCTDGVCICKPVGPCL